MISKSQIKLINSLERKKHRDELRLFVAEGEKLIVDLLPHFELHTLYTTTAVFAQAEMVSDVEMRKITHLNTPSTALGIFHQKRTSLDIDRINSSLSLVLDDIQDPGNMGTIIRIADWFGIRHVICSPNCVDVYNSKTIKSTMGAIARVDVIYTPLLPFLNQVKAPVYGTFMDGKNIYAEVLETCGLIVMGNEGGGISADVERCITSRLTIPSFGDKSSESLNVAMATSIVCSEFRRRQ